MVQVDILNRYSDLISVYQLDIQIKLLYEVLHMPPLLTCIYSRGHVVYWSLGLSWVIGNLFLCAFMTCRVCVFCISQYC